MIHPPPSLDSPAVSPTYVRLLCQTLRNIGVDPDPALHAAGLGSLQQQMNSDAPITHRAANQLIRAGIRISGRPELGLLVGMNVQISAHGAMGQALVSSATLRQALEVLVRYTPLRNLALCFRLTDTKQGAVLELLERVDLDDGHEFVTLLVFAALVQLLQTIVGKNIARIAVDLPLPEPAWSAQIRQMFSGTLRFNSQRLMFHLDQDLLHSPHMTVDPTAFAQATLECERQMAALAEPGMFSWSQRLRELLGGCERDFPTAADAARLLHLSPRTLMRRLVAEQTSYQTLIDQVRSERADRYLRETALSIDEIADRLGYRNTSNFSKSFRRWFQVTPREHRARGSSH